jgi:hypothetical protein
VPWLEVAASATLGDRACDATRPHQQKATSQQKQQKRRHGLVLVRDGGHADVILRTMLLGAGVASNCGGKGVSRSGAEEDDADDECAACGARDGASVLTGGVGRGGDGAGHRDDGNDDDGTFADALLCRLARATGESARRRHHGVEAAAAVVAGAVA